MAASLWWVILTFTWFLAAVLKWGEEAVARLWPLYHVVTWSLPAVQTILVLALQLVDGDQLSGLCYPGQFSRVALGVFVYMPLLIYLLLGTVFLVIGFSALVKIRHALERDPVKARKLGRLIIRIGVYAGLYILTNSILLFIHTYELAERESWEKSYVEGETCRSNSNPSQCENSPNFAAFLIRYIALFFVGICSTSWVFSKKTLSTWTKFFQSCGCGQVGKSDVSQAYGLPEKDPRRLQTAV
jgi:amino acid transporter